MMFASGPIFTGPTPPGQQQRQPEQPQRPKQTIQQKPKILLDANGNPLSSPKQEAAQPAVDHPDVIELTDVQEWVPKVMQEEKPVIIDCYAE